MWLALFGITIVVLFTCCYGIIFGTGCTLRTCQFFLHWKSPFLQIGKTTSEVVKEQEIGIPILHELTFVTLHKQLNYLIGTFRVRSTALLPIASDSPHVKNYRTEFLTKTYGILNPDKQYDSLVFTLYKPS